MTFWFLMDVFIAQVYRKFLIVYLYDILLFLKSAFYCAEQLQCVFFLLHCSGNPFLSEKQ